MKWKSLLMLLLCSCATQRQAEKFFDKNTDKLAEYVDQNQKYTQEHGGAYAAKHFPPRFYAPAVHAPAFPAPARLSLTPPLSRSELTAVGPMHLTCPECPEMYTVKTVYVEDTALLDSLHRELETEQLANKGFQKRLKDTEAQRDYWQEKNHQKFWTLILMAIFGVLYILFKFLASRVRETEE
ncbi:hypothetical protein [Pontibacter sp. H249]|uniref:hypothetical protein n=1 Tax=Pontibacter sp. H249 TaxID=3133420 RepID=UPI0030C463F3